MKKVLFILGILLALTVAGLAIFILTFDADRYRPLLVTQLQRAVGAPVTLEHLSLGWQKGIALRLQGLAIAENAQGSGEPLLEVESASAFVELIPLLHRDVRVTSVVLKRPRIHLIRDAQGRLNLLGLAAAASPMAAPSQAARSEHADVSFNVASLRVEDGTVHWTDAMTMPPTDLRVKAVDAMIRHIALNQPMDVELSAALAAEHPNLHVRGHLTPPSPGQSGSLEDAQLSLEGVPLDQLLPSNPQEPHLRGKLSATLQGHVATLDPAQLTQTLSGSGQFKVADPVLVNLNLLRTVFARISVIPGLVEKLEARLPSEYQTKFSAADTVLSPIDVAVRVESGALRFDDLNLRTETFRLTGSGWVGLGGAVPIRSILRIDPTLSEVLISSVKELQYLTTTNGEIEMPLVIQGQAPQLAVLPDLNYLTSKLFATKVQDLLNNFLQKAFEKHSPADAPAESPGP